MRIECVMFQVDFMHTRVGTWGLGIRNGAALVHMNLNLKVRASQGSKRFL